MIPLAISLPLRLMARPFREYGVLGGMDRETTNRELIVAGLRWSFVVGAFVAITATGRLAPFETLLAMVSFAWLPLAYVIALFVTLRLFSPSTKLKRGFALYLEGLGPWMVVWLILSGACLFAPSPAPVIFFLLPWLLLGATAWGIVLTFAMFRAGLRVTRLRSLLATFVYYVVMLAVVISYYVVAGQFWPIL